MKYYLFVVFIIVLAFMGCTTVNPQGNAARRANVLEDYGHPAK